MNSKQIWTTAVTDYNVNDKEGVGAVRTSPDGKVYRWVYNNTGSALVVGGWYFNGTTAGTYASTKTPGSGINSTFLEEIYTFGQSGKAAIINQFAGIAVSVMPSLYFGWIQVYGYHSAVKVEGTAAITVGDALKGVTAQIYGVSSTAAANAPLHRKHVMAMEAYSTGSVSTMKGMIYAL